MGMMTHERQGSGSHLAVVDALARELELPVQQVAGAYLEEVSRLEAEARIKTFVSVLAVGSVRNQLRRQRDSSG